MREKERERWRCERVKGARQLRGTARQQSRHRCTVSNEGEDDSGVRRVRVKVSETVSERVRVILRERARRVWEFGDNMIRVREGEFEARNELLVSNIPGTCRRKMTCSVLGPVWADLYDQFQNVANSYELF